MPDAVPPRNGPALLASAALASGLFLALAAGPAAVAAAADVASVSVYRAPNASVTDAVPVDVGEFPGVDRVWFDLRGVEPGTPYALELVHDGTVVDRSAAAVREPRATVGNVTVVETDAEVREQTAVRVTARLSHGGTPAVYNDACERVGWARLEAGTGRRLTIPLWRPGGEPVVTSDPDAYGVAVHAVRETGAVEPVYPGPAAVATATVDGLDCASPTPEVTPPADRVHTLPPTARPLPEPTVHTLDGTTDAGTGADGESDGLGTPGQPGFTALAALVATLLLVAVRVVRR